MIRNFDFRAIIVVCAGLTAAAANAQLIQWNTYGNLGTETTEPSVFNHSGLSASTLSFGSGVTLVSAANRFGARSWFDSGDTAAGTTLQETIDDNEYFEFTITPSSGNAFTATSFVFSWNRSSTGPGALAIRSSLDSYSTNVGSISGLSASLTTGNSITLSGLTNISSATTLRIYAYGGTASAGNGGFETSSNAINIQLNGSVSAVPEPSTYAAIFGAMALAGVIFQRRRAAARASAS